MQAVKGLGLTHSEEFPHVPYRPLPAKRCNASNLYP